MGSSIKLGISWDGSTRYLDISPPTRDDVERLGSLQLTYGEPSSPYSPFGRTTRQFKLDEPCHATGRVKIVWNNYKIQEWRQRLGDVSSHLVKKTFDNSTHDYPGVRHEQETIPKKSAVGIFPRIFDPMRGICRNKETFSVDLLENTHVGKKLWGLVFYGVKSKLLAYYILGSHT